jgi:hypothetical protein
VIRTKQYLPGTEWGRRAGWRNDPNNVCLCELIKKKKKNLQKQKDCNK